MAMMVMACLSANAQVADSALVARKGRIYSGGTRLKSSALAALDGFDMEQYKVGRSKYIGGVTMITVGALPALVSTYAVVAETINRATADPGDNRPGSGMGAMVALFSGAIALVYEGIGIPLTCFGMKNIRTAADDYNDGHQVQVSLQPSLNRNCNLQPTAGLSLALRF